MNTKPLTNEIAATIKLIAKLEQTNDHIGIHKQLTRLEQYVAGFLSSAKLEAMKHHIAHGAVKDHDAGIPRDVHTEHCCIVHGCKYDRPKCTVVTKQATQSFPCQACCS